MIELVKHDYCDNCPYFEATTQKLYADFQVQGVIVQCENYNKCDYIERVMRERLGND